MDEITQGDKEALYLILFAAMFQIILFIICLVIIGLFTYLAIRLYQSERYGPPLDPSDPLDLALIPILKIRIRFLEWKLKRRWKRLFNIFPSVSSFVDLNLKKQ